MKIFILEDDSNRMVKFRRELIGHQIDHAKTAEEGSNLIGSNKYDLIFLDHDLGGKQMVDSNNENTGYQLAKFIAKSMENKTTPCIVHSCNPAGAHNITHILQHACVIPFPSLDISFIIEQVEQHRRDT